MKKGEIRPKNFQIVGVLDLKLTDTKLSAGEIQERLTETLRQFTEGLGCSYLNGTTFQVHQNYDLNPRHLARVASIEHEQRHKEGKGYRVKV